MTPHWNIFSTRKGVDFCWQISWTVYRRVSVTSICKSSRMTLTQTVVGQMSGEIVIARTNDKQMSLSGHLFSASVTHDEPGRTFSALCGGRVCLRNVIWPPPPMSGLTSSVHNDSFSEDEGELLHCNMSHTSDDITDPNAKFNRSWIK